MKITNRTIIISAIILTVACGLGACSMNRQTGSAVDDGKKQESESGADATETILYPEYTAIVQHTEYSENRIATVYEGADYYVNTFDSNFIKDGRLFSISKIFESSGYHDYLSILDIDSGEQVFSEKNIGNTGTYFEYEGGFLGLRDNTLTAYDDEFNSVREIDLKKVYAQTDGSCKNVWWKQCFVDKDGNIGLLSDHFILLFGGEENELCGMVESQAKEFAMAAATDSGEIYVICADSSAGTQIYGVDMENGALGEALCTVSPMKQSIYYTKKTGKGNFYFVTAKKIFEYDADAQTCEEIFSIQDYGMSVDGNTVISIESPDRIYMANEYNAGKSGSEWDVELELMTAVRVNADDVKQREELVLAAFYDLGMFDKSFLLRFNKYNKDYYITVKLYQDVEQSQYAAAKQNFYNDMLGGKGADLFWVDDTTFDVVELGKKGIAEDLYGLMDADDELSADKFIPSGLKSMEYDGKLYAISPSFGMETLVGKAELLEKYDEWSFKTMYELHEEYPDADILGGITRSLALMEFMMYSDDVFYDKETKECSFTDEEFVKMLELVSTLPESVDYETPLAEQIKQNDILLYAKQVSDQSVRVMDRYYDGCDIRYIGFPSKNNSGAVLKYQNYLILSGQSEHKEAAWEFMKNMLQNCDIMESCYSVLQSRFEEQIESELEKSSTGRYTSQYSDMYGTSIELETLTQAQAQVIYDLVDSAKRSSGFDLDIYNIVTEEAQYYFSGARSAEETAAVIQDRVQLYLEERD